MIKEYILSLLKETIDFDDASQIKVDIPKDPSHGDLSTNAALVLSKKLGKKPRDLAIELSDSLKYDNEIIESISIAGPGFINFKLNSKYFFKIVEKILDENSNYGKLSINSGKRANIEWVSANPTGPLHAGHGRNIALGKAIANLLEWSGYNVVREYYYNDAGSQMDNLAKSVHARYMQIFNPDFPFPEDGYSGNYIKDIANLIYNRKKDELKSSDNLEIFKLSGEDYNFNLIKKVLNLMGISFDVFFNESSLYKTGKIEELINRFREFQMVYEKDGALWLKMEKTEGFDKDKVIVKSTGEPTYRLPDMAYHIDKVKRGFDLIVDIFGSDHGDTYKEVLYGIKKAGYDNKNINVIIHQMVTFKRGDESVRMSKRSDNVYYLEELINDVGVDATQFFFVMRNPNTHLDFDIELAKDQSDKNPVYYLQYAHARICGILRNAQQNYDVLSDNPEVDFSKLGTEDELCLIKTLGRFPEIIHECSVNLEPYKLIPYLNEVASGFHSFYHNNRVLDSDNVELSKSRLALCRATKIILSNGFRIIGISAPDKM
ncbi:MAG: arginyl-tRNA synthetase [Chlorobi bacterium OLB4]|jgi:arginyl-tRNA synthetase|nr:MAG: arginyl-tRNA synthetase [Chlorobi bacterium OLB4]MBW7856390.1 arginine--tRNA ligase [Ignavibacteria bacterium]